MSRREPFGNQDKEYFLFILDVVVKRYDWLCHAYFLMDNRHSNSGHALKW
jgi:hypothetical protein